MKIGVIDMEDDKVADEVTDMEVDKVTDMKIPIEDLTDVILVFYLGEIESPWQQLAGRESGNGVRVCQVKLKINLQFILVKADSKVR